MGSLLLVIANAGTPTAGDLYLQGILEGLGHGVTLRSDEDADDVTGFDGVVVSESVASGTIASKYVSAAIPIAAHESGYVDALGLITGEASATQSTDIINVIDATHEMMDGPYGSLGAGVHTVLSAVAVFGYLDLSGAVNLSANVTGVADLNTPEWWTALGAEGGSFPARRAYIWPTNAASSTLVTGDGEIALKNTYFWLFGLGVDTGLAWITA